MLTVTINNLNDILLNHYIFSLKLQNYHWNCKGQNFIAFHELLGKMYDETTENVDKIAEHIASLDTKAQIKIENLVANNPIGQANIDFYFKEIVEDLVECYDVLMKMVTLAIKEAESNHHYTTADLLTEILRWQQKCRWFIKSHLS